MNQRPSIRIRKHASRSGISLVEVAISTLLVGMMLIGALQCCAGLLMTRTEVSDRAIANHLAAQLLTEISNTDYLDPNDPPIFGPEEAAINRSQFDDVDDFHGWSSAPPEDSSGTALPGRTNDWHRAVMVQWVDLASPVNPTGTDSGLKRITVVVSKSGQSLAKCTALRSERADN